MDFSIYLSELTGNPSDFVKKDSLEGAVTEHSDFGDIFIFPAQEKPPAWIKEITAAWPGINTAGIYSARSGALIVIEYEKHTIIATFGTGYLHVDRDTIVPDFGRKVVITCVAEGQLKQVSRQAIEGAKIQSIEQTPKGEKLDKYGIDYERDLLKGLAGIPRKKAFGDFIAGADALHVTIPEDLNGLKKRARLYLKAYKMKIVTPELKWYDRLKRVVDSKIKNSLDQKLDDALQVKGHLEPALFLPEIVDRAKMFFSYGFQHSSSRSPAGQYPDPDIDDWRSWLTTKNLLPNLGEARKRDFYVYDAHGQDVACYKISHCLMWSCSVHGNSYFLHGGSWYSISASLVADVKNFLSIAYKTKSFVVWPKYMGGDEGSYNKLVSATIPDMILMDKNNITLAGAKTAVEPCDLVDVTSKILVFVKRKKLGSSGLAHLFTQVFNGVDAFFSHDPEMRSEMAKRMTPSQPMFVATEKPDPSQWTVVILILGVKRRGLPFFTLMGAKQVIGSLRRRYGMDVCIEYA